MEVFSYGKKENNDLLVITNNNQYVKYKDLDFWTSDPIMTNKYGKYEDFVLESFLVNKGKDY
jgi:hypothetical protein